MGVQKYLIESKLPNVCSFSQVKTFEKIFRNPGILLSMKCSPSKFYSYHSSTKNYSNAFLANI